MPWITVNAEEPKPTTFEDLGYVQVVRCKDCRYGEMDTEHFIRPSIVCKNPANGVGHVSHRPAWFCADGESKESR